MGQIDERADFTKGPTRTPCRLNFTPGPWRLQLVGSLILLGIEYAGMERVTCKEILIGNDHIVSLAVVLDCW